MRYKQRVVARRIVVIFSHGEDGPKWSGNARLTMTEVGGRAAHRAVALPVSRYS